jgi:hypothetical protein
MDGGKSEQPAHRQVGLAVLRAAEGGGDGEDGRKREPEREIARRAARAER